MELTPFEIYLIFTAGSLKTLFEVATLVLAMGCVISVAFCAIELGELPPRILAIPFASGLVLSVILATALPSTKTLIAMYGIPAAIEGTKAVASSELGNKSYRALNKLLDEYLTEKK